jgi:drug/metabolite transporter (DMT)-like permease
MHTITTILLTVIIQYWLTGLLLVLAILHVDPPKKINVKLKLLIGCLGIAFIWPYYAVLLIKTL